MPPFQFLILIILYTVNNHRITSLDIIPSPDYTVFLSDKVVAFNVKFANYRLRNSYYDTEYDRVHVPTNHNLLLLQDVSTHRKEILWTDLQKQQCKHKIAPAEAVCMTLHFFCLEEPKKEKNQLWTPL